MGASLHNDSSVPNHVKMNFIKNSINLVKSRCSTKEEADKALAKLEDRLRKNGFTNMKFNDNKKNRKREINI